MPTLGPTNHPIPAHATVIRPSVTNGSSGTWETSGSARPVERRTAPPAPPRTPIEMEKKSWMRRRLTRRAKKEFQSRAAEEGPGFAVVVAAEKKRPDEAMGRERREVVVRVVGVLKSGVEDGRALQSWRVTGDQRRATVLNGEAMVELMVVGGVGDGLKEGG